MILENKDSRTSNGIRIGSNPKSMPLHRRRRKWKPYDGGDKPLINSAFKQLVKIPIRVETPDGEPVTVPKYYYQARRVLHSIISAEIEHPFVISISDLSPYLITNLLNSHSKDYIMYRLVERIIENCDPGLLGANMKSRFVKYPWFFHP